MAALSRGLCLLRSAVSYALAAAGPAGSARLAVPTPCAGWDLGILLDHVADSMGVLSEAIAAGTTASGWPAGHPYRVGEQASPGGGGNQQRSDRQQDRRQAGRDGPQTSARRRDVPSVDGDLQRAGHRGHARGQPAVADDHEVLIRPGTRAGRQQPGGAAAQQDQRVA